MKIQFKFKTPYDRFARVIPLQYLFAFNFFGFFGPAASQAEVDLFQPTVRFFNSVFGGRIFRKVLHCVSHLHRRRRVVKKNCWSITLF